MKRINYTFNDPGLLDLALTHSSYANENRLPGLMSNERLEFLGDAVLDAVISEKIFVSYPELSEGELTKIRAGLVCEPMLSKHARLLLLNESLKMGRGEIISGGNNRDSILCDLFEAVIGAIFIDGGFDKAKRFILERFADDINSIRGNFRLSVAKTFLQEELQKDSHEAVEYRLISAEGPDHNKLFCVEAYHCGRLIGTGTGRTKKEAEQSAAYSAIDLLGLK
jgi:ribonuclease-3